MRMLLFGSLLVLFLAGCGGGTSLPEDYPAQPGTPAAAPTVDAAPGPAATETQPAGAPQTTATASAAPGASPASAASSAADGLPPDREGLLRASFSRMKDLAAVLGKVKDVASAKAVLPEVERLTDAMKTINETFALMPKLSDAEEESLAAKVRPEYQAALKALTGEMKRIRKDLPAAMEIISPLMKKLRRSNAPEGDPKPAAR
ncbi:MAG: hypothetical protein KA419_17235 [Acidobacteria bacterium]|nr:hypothetical protein [Acidobacteriota bacterium]